MVQDPKTADEFKAWIASRKDAGAKIDIETCEIAAWKAQDLDPYGVGDLPEELQQIGTCWYVRSPESEGWVAVEDLPPGKVEAMWARLDKERYNKLKELPAEEFERYMRKQEKEKANLSFHITDLMRKQEKEITALRIRISELLSAQRNGGKPR